MSQGREKESAGPATGFTTQADLEDRLRYWQHKLRLQDWRVTVAIKRAREMEQERSNGEVGIIHAKKWAEIILRDPLDVLPEYQSQNDLEETLVHELLHLHTEALELPTAGPKHIAEEHLINAVAAALVTLERK